MAATTFTTSFRKEQVREQLDTVLNAFREILDTFVSNRMRRAAAEAEHVGPRRPPGKRVWTYRQSLWLARDTRALMATPPQRREVA